MKLTAETVRRYINQPSTLKGITAVLGAFGIIIDPTAVQAILAGVAALWGIIEIFRDEEK